MILKKRLKKFFLINFIYRRIIYPYLFQSEFDIKIIRKMNFRCSIDVGASSGLYTIELSKISKQCISFEPIYEEYILLKSIIKKNVILFNYALSNRNTKTFLNIPITNKIHEFPRSSIEKKFKKQKRVKITTKKFDYLKKKISNLKIVDFVKIDVEGHEKKVVLGMKKTIIIHRPILLIEIEKRYNRNYLWLFKYLKKLDYNCFYTDDGKKLKKFKKSFFNKLQDPLNEEYDEKLKKIKKDFKRKYINNFWFFPKKT